MISNGEKSSEKSKSRSLSQGQGSNNVLNLISMASNFDINPLREEYFGNCRSVADFEKVEEVGEGTYGRVCKSKYRVKINNN
jgi:hypothetical protein